MQNEECHNYGCPIMCPQTKKWPTKPLKYNDDWNTKKPKGHKKNKRRGKARTTPPPSYWKITLCKIVLKVYINLREFDPEVIGLFLYEDFWKMIFWLVLNLKLVLELWYLEGFWFLLEDFLQILIFTWWNVWVSIILLLH